MRVKRALLAGLCGLSLGITGLASGQDRAIAIGNPVATTAVSAQDAARAEAMRLIDAWMDAKRAYDGVPGLSAGIVIDERLVWAKGYGTIDPARRVPATPSTIYSICSISKPFTAIALMQLWEQNRVRLDAPLTTYLPWATITESAADSVPITLRSLLSHAAGLPREALDAPYWSAPDFVFPTREQIIRGVRDQRTLYAANRYYQYSNLGLTLVGYTVEAVSGEPYADYMRAHVLEPLALNDTRVTMPTALYGKRLSVGWSAPRRDGGRALVKPFDARGLAPAAGFTSTVEDLAKFIIWQQRLLRTDTTELLRASTLREMQRVQFVDPDFETYFGLGFAVVRDGGTTYVTHVGSCPGYHTIFRLDPTTRTGAVVLLNAADDPRPYVRAIFALLKKRADDKFKDPVPTAAPLEDYAGRYDEQPWASESVIVPWAGGLALLGLPSDQPARDVVLLKPKGGDRFRVVRADGSEADEISFQRDPAGKVESYTRYSNASRRIS
jgi:CubicO group peptidase (beta-lactamase class C family)